MKQQKIRGRQNRSRPRLVLHPLFLIVGVWYCFTGELFLFLISCLVALQHECAHAFVASKLGYSLHQIVLMPYGAVIDGDLQGISLKDEITVALYGPLCNLFTALFFCAIWWLYPTTYAFTDTAYYSSLSIALINLLPAYPLDGGRILRCVLAQTLAKRQPSAQAERRANAIARAVTVFFSLCFFTLFLLFAIQKRFNLTLFNLSLFLLVGAIGNKHNPAVYEKMNIPQSANLKRGLLIRHIAVLETCPIKDVLRFLERDSYLVLEIYSRAGEHLCNLPQNEFAYCFERAQSPYQPLYELLPLFFHEKSG